MEPAESALAAQAHWRRGTLALSSLPPLSVYIHLPWCLRKCPYCDFNSHEWVHDPVHEWAHERAMPPGAASSAASSSAFHAAQDRYLTALRADLEQALPLVWGRPVETVFIGGGTPSLFEPQAIDRLLADLRARLTLRPGCEITLEANPGTFERDRFRAYRDAGVTRLSIGVQSFDDTMLKRIGRVHDAAQAKAAVAEARECFETWNLDLMYALPGQSLADLQSDLDTALAFKPPHLSVYHLTLEPNTRFASRPPEGLPDEDLAAQMLDLITAATGEAGLQRYEVSAFARPGHRCGHNLNYWRFGDYLGLGAGAHGKISFAHRIIRQVRWRDPATYVDKALAGAAVSNEHPIARSDLPFEYVLNALRLPEGFSLDDFKARTGLPVSTIEPALAKAQARGLIEPMIPAAAPSAEPLRVVPTARGFDFLSDLQALFLPSGKVS
jgi:oxygen-independent coproporphyrinogen-3 oxidase